MYTQHRFGLSIALLTLFAALVPTTALAGGTATMESSGHTMQVIWGDGAFRIGGLGAAQYTIIRDGKAYSVSTGHGQPRVIEMGGMIKMMAKTAGQSQKQESAFDHVDSVKATGASATVAGIEGHVYRMTTTGADGQTETTKVVLTGDPLVTEMTQAYMGAMQTLVGTDVGQFMAALPDGRRGLLRAGTNYRVTSISGEDPAAGVFELPAEPTSFAEMMQRLHSQ